MDQLEKWIYDNFYRISNLNDSMSGNIDIKTFDLYFKYYPITCMNKLDFIHVMSTISRKINIYNDQVRKHKSENQNNKKGR